MVSTPGRNTVPCGPWPVRGDEGLADVLGKLSFPPLFRASQRAREPPAVLESWEQLFYAVSQQCWQPTRRLTAPNQVRADHRFMHEEEFSSEKSVAGHNSDSWIPPPP